MMRVGDSAVQIKFNIIFLTVVTFLLGSSNEAWARGFTTGNKLFTPCLESSIDTRTQSFPCSALVSFDSEATESHRNEAFNRVGLINAHRFGPIRVDEAVIGDRASYLSLQSSPHVAGLTPNRIMKAHGKPTPSIPNQLVPTNIVRIGATP